MYKSEHADFIIAPLFDILGNAIYTCRGIDNSIESYPLSEYIMQSLFLKLTGAQEQKLKCICWDIATHDYEYRYELMNKKNYGEYSDWNSKNGVYNDLIEAIKKIDSTFEPKKIIDNFFLENLLSQLLLLYEGSVLEEWQSRELNYYKSNYKSIIKFNQLGLDRQNSAKHYQLFQSVLKNMFEEVVYKHRNRCAHNTLSYQLNKPDLRVLADLDYEYNSYFFRFSILVLIDSIFIVLFKWYLNLKTDII